MGCLGVHFALSEPEVERIRSLRAQAERLDFVIELGETYFDGREKYFAESDKAWDAMHRAFSDGHLTWDGGEYPLNHVVLAGESLYTQSDYILSLKTPQQVRDIAAALDSITEVDFRSRYGAIDHASYSIFSIPDEDFGYTWGWFQNVRRLYERAAAEGRFVLFTASQ